MPGRTGSRSWRRAAAVGVLLAAAGCQAPPAGDGAAPAETVVSDDTQAQITDSLVLAAQASESSGDWAGATKYWGSLLERDPDNERYAIGVADGLRHTGRYEDAVQVMVEARRRHPDSAAVLAALGKAQLADGRREEAIVSLTEATARAPHDWRALSALAVAYGMAGQSELADQYHRQALAQDPDNAVVLNNYALHLAITGRFEEGLAVMEQAAGTLGAPSQVRQNHAVLLAIAGRIGEAEEIVRAELPREAADQQMAFLRTLSASDLINLDEIIDRSSLTIESSALAAPPVGNVANLTNLDTSGESDFLAEEPVALPPAEAVALEEPALEEPALEEGAIEEAGIEEAVIEEAGVEEAAEAPEPEPGLVVVQPADDLPAPPPEPAALETAVIADTAAGAAPTPAQEAAAVNATLADLLGSDPAAQSLVVAPLPEPAGMAATPPAEDGAAAAIAAPAPEPQPEPATGVAAPEPEPAAAPAGGPWRVQIASLPTEELARQGRDDILADHPAVLGGVDVEIAPATLDGGGTTWRVYAGRYADRSAATGLCEALKAAGGDCFVTKDASGG